MKSSDGDGLLKRAARVKMIEKISLVRLVPTHLVRRDRANVQAIDVRRGDEARAERITVSGKTVELR